MVPVRGSRRNVASKQLGLQMSKGDLSPRKKISHGHLLVYNLFEAKEATLNQHLTRTHDLYRSGSSTTSTEEEEELWLGQKHKHYLRPDNAVSLLFVNFSSAKTKTATKIIKAVGRQVVVADYRFRGSGDYFEAIL